MVRRLSQVFDQKKNVLKFGKFKGKKLSEVPKTYIRWLAAHDHQGISEAQKWVRENHLVISEEARCILETNLHCQFAF